MAKKIYLSTYSLKILDRRQPVLLKSFNGNLDFFDFFKGFTNHIFQNIKKTNSYGDKTELHLTLEAPAKTDVSQRVIYGYLSSGVGGDKYKVRISGETDTEFESDPDKHVTYRDLFFYLQLPINQKFGYLIIQKKRDFGAKRSLQKALNTYLTEQGYRNYYAEIDNLLNGRVFDRMLENGNLKNIDLIKKTIPSTIEQLYEKGPNIEKGILTTSIKSHSSLSTYWKNFISTLYRQDRKHSLIEINDGLDSLDEVEFELELKGKKKTFHVFAKNRTQPDVEVSDDLSFNQNEPTTESLVFVCENLIADMLTLTPNVSAS